MELSDAALRWLRAMAAAPPDPGRSPAELVLDGLAVADLARRTPAWAEPHTRLLDRLVDALAGPADADRDDPSRLQAGRRTLEGLRAALGHGPQVVDVDLAVLALRRAEWAGGCLLLDLAPPRPDPRARTRFRVVGLEPRMWYQTGIDGATTDVASHAMVVHVPLVAGPLEFTPGSY